MLTDKLTCILVVHCLDADLARVLREVASVLHANQLLSSFKLLFAYLQSFTSILSEGQSLVFLAVLLPQVLLVAHYL